MRVALLTREWPPDVYGGAGVHVEYLAKHLRDRIDVDVHCFGEPRRDATAHASSPSLVDANPALRVLSTDLSMAAGVGPADVVHSHTWYANLAGHLTALVEDVPHVATCHSLEPLRPWKAEQLGGGYGVSCWAERTALESAAAVIAVSQGMRGDVLATYPAVSPDRVHVVHNGIDTEAYQPDRGSDVLDRVGIDPARPSVAFVGRITRQKGVPHLLAAAHGLDPEAQLILCAGAADTPELGGQVAEAVSALKAERSGVVWIQEMLPRPDLVQILSHATVFVCPSVYEPLGIVNLEAMACGTAVVASDVGGIPEVVQDGETGLLVRYDAEETARFETEFADSVNDLLGDPARAAALGAAGRRRAVAEFGWDKIAQQTIDVYHAALG